MLPDLVASQYPFTSRFLDLDGLRYHYLDEGAGEETLVFLHGNPTWSFYYRRLIATLRDRYRCVAPDHVGCGLSDKPQDYAYRLENHVRNLGRLIAHLGLERYTLIVHDWGGPIGLGHAVAHPGQLSRLVVLNSTVEVTRHYPWRILACRWPLLGPLAIRGANFFADGATRLAVCRPLPPEVRAGYLAPYDSWANRIANLRFVQDIPLSPEDPSYAYAKKVEERVSELPEVPVLVCWGLRDFCFTPAFLAGWRLRFPQAEVHEFPDAGHYVLEDAAEPILELVQQFLRGDDA